VYVVGAGDKAEPRQIVTSHLLGTDWIVASGLAPGDRVVVEGIGKVRPGSPVKPVPLPGELSGGSSSAPTIAPVRANPR
jgi:membrane fusion protein, multidrug efflux system